MGDRKSGAELQDTPLAQSHRLASPQLPWLLGKVLPHFGSVMAPCWAQSLCSVGVHISWHFTYKDNGCRSPKLPLSSGSSKTKAEDSTSPMLVTVSCSCQDALHCINTMLKSAPFTLATLHVPSCPIFHLPLPFQGVQYLLATASFCLHCSPQKQPFFPPVQPLIIPARSHSPSQDGLLDVHWA